MRLHPQGGEKNFRRNLQTKFVSAPHAHQVHPQGEQETIYKTFLLGGGDFLEVHLVPLDRLLKATTKMVITSTFLRKIAPARQNPGTNRVEINFLRRGFRKLRQTDIHTATETIVMSLRG